MALDGYLLRETIYEGVRTIVYRGIKESDRTSVIVKTLKSEYQTLEEITRLRHEYQILQTLEEIEGVVESIGLENYQNGLAIILKDSGEESLKQIMDSCKITLKLFLKIGIELAKTLQALHQRKIIHKDIKPHNILIDTKTFKVKIIDFSIATRLSRENQALANPQLLEGTLAYMSPEQTGRMNRYIDYRTDFYSLGITFYEILTGQLPFTTDDPMELVHCHIAKQPIPPHQIKPDIPLPISDIVMKLLAKNAEDRYQSALGLKIDLEECLAQIETTGKIENFIPAQRDKCGQFLIPQKLYGRQAEVKQLIDTFEEVSRGNKNCLLVSGYSGIGKSSLIYEIHKPIVKARGYFISGKFEQYKRNIPYAALVQAFSELVNQILTETPEKIAIWKEKILTAVGANGKVIAEVIPEIELLIGSQPTVPALPPTESQNRFNRVIKQFIRVFTKKEHPLVLFLDDLQWADNSSLKLIELLITDSEIESLLMIGAYRDNEVNPTHPLIQTLEEIREKGVRVNNIVLQPLNYDCVKQLVADTLHDTENSQTLAELVFKRTQGNPFLLTQMLSTLYDERILWFDFNKNQWKWDIEEIYALGITENSVVELLARNIQKLSEETVNILKLAACIGNKFNLDVLAVVNEKSAIATANQLWEALQMGLILPCSQAYKIPLFFDEAEQGVLFTEEFRVSYKFLHDRVQQAAYSLIPEAEKKNTHLKIGRLLLEKTPKEALEENIFDIVNQLNIGRELLSSRLQKDELARLNLIAGKKAKTATAYEVAAKYLRVGLELLAEDSWQNQYELTLELHVEATEAEYLNTNFERARELSKIILQHAATLLDTIKVYEIIIQFYTAQNQMQSALNTGIKVLEILGISLEKQLPQPVTVEQLNLLPEMTDPYKLAAMRILSKLIASAFIADPELFPQIIYTMVTLSVKYGNSSLAAVGYNYFGAILCGLVGDFETGYRFGKLAVKMVDKFNAREIKGKVWCTFNVMIRVWKEHVRETIAPLMEAFNSALEVGNLGYAGLCLKDRCTYLFVMGENLESVERQFKECIDILYELKQDYCIYFAKVWQQVVSNLLHPVAEPTKLSGDNFDETTMLPHLIATKNRTSLFSAYLAKGMLLYLFKDYAQALENLKLAAQHFFRAEMKYITVGVHNFYSSLAALALYVNASPDEQKIYAEQIETNQKEMRQWGEHSPSNFKHKYELVEAVRNGILGKYLEAMELFDSAIAGAKAQGYIQEEALAYELAAEFYLALGREKIAKTYLTEAYYTYIRWGAITKVRDLEKRYPHLFISNTVNNNIIGSDLKQIITTTGGNSQLLDLTTVIKASQAISSEMVLSNLLEKLIKIAIENAGATRGCWLEKRESQWLIEAEGTLAPEEVTVLQEAIPIENSQNLPKAVIYYVERTRKPLVLDEAAHTKNFASDPYIATKQPKSILCVPVIYKGRLNGILYLENHLTTGVFTSERIEILKVLSSQVSISIENARLYQKEQEKSRQLEKYLHELQQTQAQLVHTEKISSLGQLVAGIAHEVNNPVNFISGNLNYAMEYAQNAIALINLYRKEYPNPPAVIAEAIANFELDYLIEDLPHIIDSMRLGIERIRELMQSLRNFSRIDSEKKLADIHAGIDSTLTILQHRLKPKGEAKGIKVVKEYGNLPKVLCYAGQLNQVFMNILANAIDAMESARLSSEKQIYIRTELQCHNSDNQLAIIRIKDNGPGMTEEVRQKLFQPFFTTKPEGKGTGLGLAIAHQIVVEKHQGYLECISAPGEGAEFVIAIPIQQHEG
ncbi:MAG: trifunctional serine/threonine-protein kinase/ATP-binding protein/sensor histidine kinase [Oscillatoriaceae bacterium SKW80]|nr:trifunctional serine/threonine-protein kinase/ATP-binding protein/sensor histidine kinase [Oscillatoriaceae bacterium SKYG93]MCX8120155.1 trifunctional serine/threonine-protein kinase/ATP-binding protein/sensor histidine kinase [Oscillatoriaceae bacterium SKW80]MDW8453081.1 AAA family ATPase [Oscillatoriaceae cyanobacterium SKYGB_i_bin93]HIK29008.1 AAA family ATPase [Oscillatoriaceae cyanobacterium M7585_C2015_266]